jgi:hypothetical protein
LESLNLKKLSFRQYNSTADSAKSYNNAKDYFPYRIVAYILLDEREDSSCSNYKAWNRDRS